MLQPIRDNRARRRVAQAGILPPPVKGWDTSSSLAEMPPDHAMVLDNFFPDYRTVRLRNGYSEHATNVGSATSSVDTLMTWYGKTSEKLFAAADTTIYEVTSAGTATSSLSSMSNARWQHANFANAGGSYLIAVNGVDTPRAYDGSSWTALSITGSATPGDFIDIAVYKSRLWFAEESGGLAVKYLGTNAIQGTAFSFNLGGLCKLGGSLQKITTVSVDGGDGPEDYIAFITSEGEVVAYNGDDPADPTAWALTGVYRVGKPLGRRCAMRYGGDVILMTVDGFVSLTAQVMSDRASSERNAISARISPYINEIARAGSSRFGWDCVSYPRGRYLLFNVPTTEGAEAEQAVMNANTGAWCRFTGMDAQSWAVLNDKLYFGGLDGTVYLADDGFTDNGAEITGDVQTAFRPIGDRTTAKRVNMVRPRIFTDGEISPGTAILADYDDRTPALITLATGVTGTAWDDGDWDTFFWASDSAIKLNWLGASALGFVFSARTQVRSDMATCELAGWDILYETGEPL